MNWDTFLFFISSFDIGLSPFKSLPDASDKPKASKILWYNSSIGENSFNPASCTSSPDSVVTDTVM